MKHKYLKFTARSKMMQAVKNNDLQEFSQRNKVENLENFSPDCEAYKGLSKQGLTPVIDIAHANLLNHIGTAETRRLMQAHEQTTIYCDYMMHMDAFTEGKTTIKPVPLLIIVGADAPRECIKEMPDTHLVCGRNDKQTETTRSLVKGIESIKLFDQGLEEYKRPTSNDDGVEYTHVYWCLSNSVYYLSKPLIALLEVGDKCFVIGHIFDSKEAY